MAFWLLLPRRPSLSRRAGSASESRSRWHTRLPDIGWLAMAANGGTAPMAPETCFDRAGVAQENPTLTGVATDAATLATDRAGGHGSGRPRAEPSASGRRRFRHRTKIPTSKRSATARRDTSMTSQSWVGPVSVSASDGNRASASFLDRGHANQSDARRKFLRPPSTQPGFPRCQQRRALTKRSLGWPCFVDMSSPPNCQVVFFPDTHQTAPMTGGGGGLSCFRLTEAIVGSRRAVSKMPVVKGGLEMTG
jgi:hypothetical protein